MKNRDVYQQDPDRITLLNNGVAAMTDALDEDERRTLRFELGALRLRRPVPERTGSNPGDIRQP